MGQDIDAILDSLFRGGRLNLRAKDNGITSLEKEDTSLEDIQKINDDFSKSLKSSIDKLTKQVQSEPQEQIVFPEENEKVHIAQITKTPEVQFTMTEKLNNDFKLAEESVNSVVIGQEEFVSELALALKRPYVAGIDSHELSAAVVLIGASGTGKHFALQLFVQKLGESGVLPNGKLFRIDLSKYNSADSEKVFIQDLYSASKDPAKIILWENYEKAHSTVLSMVSSLFSKGSVALPSRYAEQKGVLVNIGTALVPSAVSSISLAGKYLFLLTDKPESKLLDAFGAPFLSACNDICRTQEFSAEHINKIATHELSELCEKVKKRLSYIVSYDDEAVSVLCGKFIRDLGAESLQIYTENLYKALAEYKLKKGSAKKEGKIEVKENELQIKFTEDTVKVNDGALADKEKTVQKVKDELKDIIGLNKVKQYILSLEDNFLIQQIRREKGLKADFPAMHMIFTGNPGTGKTTVARLVSRYLKAIGVLSGGQLIEVTRADLVGQYVGHTAPLTQKAIASALGGVLFIDEAYSLFRGTDDSFGLEAIDTLVKGMEDNRDNLVVILAGYTGEMEEFLTANSGLKSRFPNIIEFEDYTADELLKIIKLMVKSKGYILDNACDEPLLKYFEFSQSTGDSSTNGNARMARNKLEEAILNCSRRNIAAPEHERNLELIVLEDFNLHE